MLRRLWVAVVLLLAVAACAGTPESTPTGSLTVSPTRGQHGTPRTGPTSTPSDSRAGAEGAGEVAAPARLSIPTIGVDAEMIGVGLKSDGAMETPPYDSNLVGWYIEGPRPGEPGPAVIAAHVDSKTGRDVFWRLRELESGDEVTVTDTNGRTYTFAVESTENVPKNALPYDRIWNRTSEPVLRLVTCAGPYDASRGGYQENLVVYASPTE
ncbi:MAG TPA: class F sortase [Actinopolymorphaceae bacterium]